MKALAGDSDFMAGGWNGAGQAPDVTHQPPGDGKQESLIKTVSNFILYQALSTVVRAAPHYACYHLFDSCTHAHFAFFFKN